MLQEQLEGHLTCHINAATKFLKFSPVPRYYA